MICYLWQVLSQLSPGASTYMGTRTGLLSFHKAVKDEKQAIVKGLVALKQVSPQDVNFHLGISHRMVEFLFNKYTGKQKYWRNHAKC